MKIIKINRVDAVIFKTLCRIKEASSSHLYRRSLYDKRPVLYFHGHTDKFAYIGFGTHFLSRNQRKAQMFLVVS